MYVLGSTPNHTLLRYRCPTKINDQIKHTDFTMNQTIKEEMYITRLTVKVCTVSHNPSLSEVGSVLWSMFLAALEINHSDSFVKEMDKDLSCKVQIEW